jgi:hypothetical protein
MTGRFPFQRLAKYPHMKPEDVAAWERFIDTNPGYFESVDYDVAVGEGAPTNPEHPENIQHDHTILTQKKIDVVGYRGATVTVVEVKPIADMRALGQALVYSHLYAADHPEVTDLQRMVVAGEMERELAPIYAAQSVQFELA